MPLLGVIFDFDGVIADTEPLHLRAYQDVLAGGPMSISEADYRARYLGYDDLGVFKTVAADHRVALAAEELDRLREAKERRFAELIGTTDVVYPAARKCIERLAPGLVLGIASGALHREIEDILNAAGLRRHFTAIVAADDVSRAKPAPDLYTRAVGLLCQALGRAPSADGFVAIEDSRWGIQSANAAGLACIGVTTTYSARALRTATAVVSSLAEVNQRSLSALC